MSSRKLSSRQSTSHVLKDARACLNPHTNRSDRPARAPLTASPNHLPVPHVPPVSITSLHRIPKSGTAADPVHSKRVRGRQRWSVVSPVHQRTAYERRIRTLVRGVKGRMFRHSLTAAHPRPLQALRCETGSQSIRHRRVRGGADRESRKRDGTPLVPHGWDRRRH